MACRGAHCSSHGTGTTTCSGHRGSCPSNRTFSPSGGFGSTSSTITAADIDRLRALIKEEISAYDAHRDHIVFQRQDGSYSTGDEIDNTHINDMESMVYEANIIKEQQGINYAKFTDWGFNSGISRSEQPDGTTIRASHWNTLRDRYNVMRQDCICNSDCACNLVCACHNDCGCNYSDERLKENIQFIETRCGINWYSFNYIWDKNKTHVGVIAQEILKTKYKNAVKKDSNGFYMVNYSLLPK